MGSLSDFAEAELLDHVFNAAYTPPTTVYLGLSTADPLDDASGLSEPSGDGYVRKAITFGAAASRKVTQNADVDYDQATGAWGLITHYGVFDAESGGNMLGHGALGQSKQIVSGNTPSVKSGEVYIEYSTGDISNYLAHKLLDLMFRNVAYSAPDTYLALCTAVIADDDTGSTITEPSGGSYARKQVNPNGGAAPDWNLATGTTPTVVDNSDEVALAEATADWGTIVAAAICDALTAGNLLMYDNDMSDQPVSNGDIAKFPAGDLDNTMS